MEIIFVMDENRLSLLDDHAVNEYRNICSFFIEKFGVGPWWKMNY